jgi:hypothetical protein
LESLRRRDNVEDLDLHVDVMIILKLFLEESGFGV